MSGTRDGAMRAGATVRERNRARDAELVRLRRIEASARALSRRNGEAWWCYDGWWCVGCDEFAWCDEHAPDCAAMALDAALAEEVTP